MGKNAAQRATNAALSDGGFAKRKPNTHKSAASVVGRASIISHMRQPTSATSPDYLLIGEAAEIARASIPTVRYWIQTRRLRARRPGRRVLIRRSDLLAFLDGAAA